MITRRDLMVALIAVATTVCVVDVLSGSRAETPVMQSTLFDWNAVTSRPTDVGAVRQFFRAPTATLDELECHVTTLKPGATSHAPHRHPNEELVIVKEGTVEALVNGELKRAGPGSVIFNASNQLHGIRNVGDGPATYHVINWSSPGMLKKTE
ncbi:MAG: cupin domain-containing protein [Pyrinomonadaceae bacterium]|nr:cupin domain-containing protein [Pyrinomonadaceae bacterium]